MPIYEQRDEGLRAFTQVKPGPDLFETEIEEMAWNGTVALMDRAGS
jgi:hypothetical protein